MMGKEIKIEYYSKDPLTCKPYDPLASLAAGEIMRNIYTDHPDIKIEHVGSSAVPGCDGKGIIDLLLAVSESRFDEMKSYIDGLGFQKQSAKNNFPEDRPMRVGAYRFNDAVYNVHVHIIKDGAPEIEALIKFRDKLRSDENLVKQYIAEKKKILSLGINDSTDYSNAKTDFIKSILND